MSWYLVPYHIIAHLQPTVNAGTITAGWPVGNICGFNPTKHTKWTTAGLDLIWDRGAANQKSFNAFLLTHHNQSGGTHRVYADSSATPTTALYTAQNITSNKPLLYVWDTANASRYVRAVLSATTGEVGFLSLCRAYDVGDPIRGSVSYSGGGGGGQEFSGSGDMDVPGLLIGGGSVSARFQYVARSTGTAIRDELGQAHAELATGFAQYAVSAAGGGAPMALWDATDERLWYGFGTVQVTEAGVNTVHIAVSIQDWPYGAFF